MSDTAKRYAQEVLNGYGDVLKRLKHRYTSAVSAIDAEHNAINAEIRKKAQKDKNMADTASKVSLKNIQRGLLDRGLSGSGASVQAEVDSNLAKNSAFSSIDATASKERSANETARAKSKAAALAEYIDSANTAEMKKNEEYMSQLNADRAYEAEREDEKFDRYVTNRAYEADREDEKFDRYVTNRAYDADREDEKFDRYAENRAYDADREDEKYDRYADERDYETERKDVKYNRMVDERDFQAERKDVAYERMHSGDGAGGVDPKISPVEFVEKIKGSYYSKGKSDTKKRDNNIRNAIDVVINDESLSYDYRYQVKIYAQALGLYW